MKWAYLVKDKMKAVAVLLLIIILILVNNITNRRTFSSLNESIASIYKDRLMPATYIFQLTDHLYQQRLLHADAIGNSEIYRQHAEAINSLIKTYEATYLTSAEREEWGRFKSSLRQFETLNNAAVRDEKAVDASFRQTMASLNALSSIQASEGSNLFKTSSIHISGTIITSQLEMALLIILGVFALILVSANDNKLMRMQKQGLN